MNRRAEIERQEEMRGRVVLKLLSLAAHAERASVRTWPIRLLLLWILRPAEAAARNYALWALDMLNAVRFGGARGDDPGDTFTSSLQRIFRALSMQIGPGSHGHSAEDAVRLACCFRALAQAFEVLPIAALVDHWAVDQVDALPEHTPAFGGEMRKPAVAAFEALRHLIPVFSGRPEVRSAASTGAR